MCNICAAIRPYICSSNRCCCKCGRPCPKSKVGIDADLIDILTGEIETANIHVTAVTTSNCKSAAPTTSAPRETHSTASAHPSKAAAMLSVEAPDVFPGNSVSAAALTTASRQVQEKSANHCTSRTKQSTTSSACKSGQGQVGIQAKPAAAASKTLTLTTDTPHTKQQCASVEKVKSNTTVSNKTEKNVSAVVSAKTETNTKESRLKQNTAAVSVIKNSTKTAGLSAAAGVSENKNKRSVAGTHPTLLSARASRCGTAGGGKDLPPSKAVEPSASTGQGPCTAKSASVADGVLAVASAKKSNGTALEGQSKRPCSKSTETGGKSNRGKTSPLKASTVTPAATELGSQTVAKSVKQTSLVSRMEGGENTVAIVAGDALSRTEGSQAPKTSARHAMMGSSTATSTGRTSSEVKEVDADMADEALAYTLSASGSQKCPEKKRPARSHDKCKVHCVTKVYAVHNIQCVPDPSLSKQRSRTRVSFCPSAKPHDGCEHSNPMSEEFLD